MTMLAQSAEVESILGNLAQAGYCIVPDVLDADALALVRGALDRECAADDENGTAIRYGPDNANQRIWAMLNRGEEFVLLATHPLALEIVRGAMGTDVLLAQLSANVTAPGADRDVGRLHTDQGFMPEPFPQMLVLNVAWFLDDFTEENGATLVVPGSHLSLAYPQGGLAPSAPARLTGKAGSMAVFDGRLHHATGLNRTADQKRRGVFATYYMPFLRTQENWTVSLDRALLDRHPGLAALTGFKEWQTLGSINGPTMSGLNF
ncbi:Ectoine hydroxylase-related dioxygenase, phytanoyl-CoA dioxygenase (PhyH) family [Novosphingobium sp. CF614]|uniref:phytanoyl-CoA dioxygenase family protein n=1 Tax=Novosphingobium sp. CF614 TaxID=1884364 RepID=UPI0008EB4B2D|nr:phytanoyl-CoA dioxygenase family protein [Novosphingobium sp. CF614]SFF91699.1 Ectoine hydroxylase-related dioxygenase, phytanoyl-CoA dioxygenase (PhyH) family [Novosphingobium sp. CF614]